jgi:hypothetical protein
MNRFANSIHHLVFSHNISLFQQRYKNFVYAIEPQFRLTKSLSTITNFTANANVHDRWRIFVIAQNQLALLFKELSAANIVGRS